MKQQTSAELLAHLAGETLSVATIVKITRTDGAAYGFTTHDAPIVFDGLTYDTISSVDLEGALLSKGDMSIGGGPIRGLCDADGFDAADIEAGLWDYATLEVSTVNWRDLTMGCDMLPGAELGEVQLDGLQFTAELRGLEHKLQNIVGHTVQASCQAIFGDANCKVVLSPTWQRSVTVTAVVSDREFTTTLAEANDWARYGKVAFLTGAAAGLSMEIKSQTAGAIVLHLDMQRPVQVGDTLIVTAGCDHVHQVEVDAEGYATGVVTGDCKNRYSNVVNLYRASPFMTTQKAATLFGGQE